ncbi:GlxA family transcriptional regulator [Krasilnikovia sp. M28-CT-15]|uniref:GlxA family transcriptional regulator n=1 Tax=Krasilnikovia sp. M28-CT-15 TaxID=3373540 RepID=UPI0038770270
MHRVAVLALPGVYPFELGIANRVFGSAHDRSGAPLYEVVTASTDGAPVPTAGDYTIAVPHGPQPLSTADTVVVPAVEAFAPVFTEGRLNAPLAAALAHVRPGTRLVSICTGAYVLAAAGHLDGRPATNHWSCAGHFQRLFPRVAVDPDVLFVDDGDVLTSAGAAAGLDLCLHLVRRDHGSEVANATARRCVVPAWRDGGQAQYIERPMPAATQTSTSATRAWALQRLDRPLPLEALARHARMSVRTFTRRFRQEVGMTPGHWLVAQRVELARQLLESTDHPVDRIAGLAGFGTGASLRTHLRASTGVSPDTYRRAFHRIGDPAHQRGVRRGAAAGR